MSDDVGGSPDGAEPMVPNVEVWTRNGFVGDTAALIRAQYSPDYISVEGPHAPHRIELDRLTPADAQDADALPLAIMTSREGVQLSVSARSAPMPFVIKNVEADELHFVQLGELRFETDFGPITAEPGDFVCIPRAVAYRVTPVSTPTLTLVTEIPWQLSFDTPAPFGMVNFDEHVSRPTIAVPGDPGGETTLLLKSFDGVTRYLKPHDPLAAIACVSGQVPVWKLNIANVSPVTYLPIGGPPMHFLTSPHGESLLYTLRSRPGMRPPIHHNADYDELIYYVEGPGAWGSVSKPGTLTWVPKGATHQGPPEDVAEGYVAWLLETRPTLRLTPAGAAGAELMETDMYGRHPSETTLRT